MRALCVMGHQEVNLTPLLFGRLFSLLKINITTNR